jgi:hypothetical protein
MVDGGTRHALGRFEWVFPGPEVARALRESDTVALEIGPSDPHITARTQAAMQNPAGAPPLPKAVKSRLEPQFELACVPAEAFAPLHPVCRR